MFITAFTIARHLSLIWTTAIQSMVPPPTSWRSISILSSHLSLDLPNGLFPSGLPTKILYTILLSAIRASLFLTFTKRKYYPIEDAGTCGTCRTHGIWEMHALVPGKHEGKRRIETHEWKWQDNIRNPLRK